MSIDFDIGEITDGLEVAETLTELWPESPWVKLLVIAIIVVAVIGIAALVLMWFM